MFSHERRVRSCQPPETFSCQRWEVGCRPEGEVSTLAVTTTPFPAAGVVALAESVMETMAPVGVAVGVAVGVGVAVAVGVAIGVAVGVGVGVGVHVGVRAPCPRTPPSACPPTPPPSCARARSTLAKSAAPISATPAHSAASPAISAMRLRADSDIIRAVYTLRGRSLASGNPPSPSANIPL